MAPVTKYAQSGDVSIAYQVTGEGPLDLVMVQGTVTHLDLMWEEPHLVRYLERLASFARVIMFDKRGVGLSDRVQVATLEQRMDDVRAVMDAVGSERAALFGVSEGGAMAALFAATYPQRTSALILFGAYAKEPDSMPEAEMQAYAQEVRRHWGTTERAKRSVSFFAPSQANDPVFLEWFTKLLRQGTSPGAAIALAEMNNEIDVSDALGVIHVPTLVIHRVEDRVTPIRDGQGLAAKIADSKLVELHGQDHFPWLGDADSVLDEVEEFLTGVRDPLERNRVLATVMFTDIVDSTGHALELGDHKWRALLNDYYVVVRKQLARFHGQEVDTAGDGFFSTFDGPARAIRCALGIAEHLKPLGIEIRTGIHTGECELIGNKVGGIAVHIGARVISHAGPNQVLVSSTVKDLVAGSGIRFQDRGRFELKGIPGEWHLFQVAN